MVIDEFDLSIMEKKILKTQEDMQFMQHDQSTIIEQMRIYDDLKKQNLQSVTNTSL